MAENPLNPVTDLICSECEKKIEAGLDYTSNEDGTVKHANEDDCEK